jgi:hypothetical protein
MTLSSSETTSLCSQKGEGAVRTTCKYMQIYANDAYSFGHGKTSIDLETSLHLEPVVTSYQSPCTQKLLSASFQPVNPLSFGDGTEKLWLKLFSKDRSIDRLYLQYGSIWINMVHMSIVFNNVRSFSIMANHVKPHIADR